MLQANMSLQKETNNTRHAQTQMFVLNKEMLSNCQVTHIKMQSLSASV